MVTEFGKFIRIKRLQLGINMREMAVQLNVTSTFLSSIELGKQYCSDNVFNSICKVLNLSEQEKKDLDDLRRIAVNDSKFVKISVKDKDKKRLVEFARALSDNRFTDEQLDDILKGVSKDE